MAGAGQPYETLLGDAAYHEGPRWRWRPAEGESLVDVYERVVPAFERIARESIGRDVVLVRPGTNADWPAVPAAPRSRVA